MDRYSADFEARVAMLLTGEISGTGTIGTYNAATHDFFDEAFGFSSLPTSPSGRESLRPTTPKYQDPTAGLGNAEPYYRLPPRVERFRGENVQDRFAGPSTPRSGSVLNPHVGNSSRYRSPSQTPTLGSGSSPSESGQSDFTPITSPIEAADQQQQLRPNGRQTYNAHHIPTVSPSPKPIARSQQRRPPRASENHRDASACICEYGCDNVSPDGSREAMSFTRRSDRTRHYKAKHKADAELYQCQGCTYRNTRLDKVRQQWRKKCRKDEGEVFDPITVTREVRNGVDRWG